MRDSWEIEAVNTAEAHIVGEVIGHAFADDPVNRWVFGTGAMIPTFTALARHVYLARGFGHVAYDESGQAKGAAMWLADHQHKEAGLWTTLRVAGTIARTAGVGAMRRGLAIDKAFTRAHPAQSHAFLFAIGVMPDAQGKGVGGALLRAGLRPIDALGLPCYLESTKEVNIPLYQRFGFELLPPMPLPDGCPPIWPMWRPPQGPGFVPA